jgi:hypothetical protein
MDDILSGSICVVARDCCRVGVDCEKNSPVTDANPEQRWLVTFEPANAGFVIAQPFNGIVCRAFIIPPRGGATL